jgi:hypothetical protein
LSFPIASSFPAKTIDLGAVPIAWTVEVTDTTLVSDYLEKTPQKSLKDAGKGVEAFSKTATFYRDFVEIGIPCDFLARDVLKPFIDSGKATEYVQIAGILTLTDTAKVVEAISKTVTFHLDLTDAGKVADLISKVVAFHVDLADTGKSLDFISKTTLRNLFETGILSDYMCKDVLKPFTDAWKTADWSKISSAKSLAETVKGVDWLTKTAIFYRDLYEVGIPCDFLAKDVLRNFFDWAVGEHIPAVLFGKEFRETISVSEYVGKDALKAFTDAGKGLDYMCKDVLKPFVDTSKAVDWYSKTTLKIFTDAGKSLDYFSKTPSKYLAETVKTLDFLEKTPLKALLDSSKAVDWYSKSVISTIFDRVYGEHYPAKDMLKVYVDTSIASDWLVTVGKFVREFTDIGKVSEYISKTPLKALLDTTIVKDIFSRTVSWIKTFEYEAPATGWLTRTVGYYRDFADTVKGLDWRGAFDILRNFREFVIARDQARRVLSLILVDQFIGEYSVARGIAPAVRDKGKPRDLLTKIAYTICGYDVRRVEIVREWLLYERKELIDYILPEDYNVRIDIAKCLLEAMKRLKEKLG